MRNIIEITGLSKSFKDIKAVDNLSFRVKEGELFAFLGVNGAGKSTTINIMCAQLARDSGEIIIDSKKLEDDTAQTKRKLGVVYQNSVLDKSLTVYDNLKFRASLYNIYGDEFKQRLDELCKLLDLNVLLKRTFDKLSGGQRRRVDIARALLHKPKILILDEPTTGLDPQTRKNIWNVIEELRKNAGVTVFLTTHYMEEAADADYVVIIDSGKIAAEGTPLELKNSYSGDFITVYNADKEKFKSLGLEFEEYRNAIKLSVANTEKARELITTHPALFSDFEITKGKMDDIFLAVTGKKLTGDDIK